MSSSESDADTASLHIYYQQVQSCNITGTSDASTILIETDNDDDESDDDNDNGDVEEIDAHIFEFIANSVFAFSLLKLENVIWQHEFTDNSDEPMCKMCKYD